METNSEGCWPAIELSGLSAFHNLESAAGGGNSPVLWVSRSATLRFETQEKLLVKRREFITLLGGAAAAWPLVARAQQLKVAQIGVLALTNADGQLLTRELRLGLRDLGYSEGRNFVFQ